MLKLNNRPKGDHATHFWGWIKRPIAQSLVCEYSYENDISESGPMMWMSFVMDGNKQKSKELIVKHKALKWVKTNSAFPKRSTWRVFMVDGMSVTLFS